MATNLAAPAKSLSSQPHLTLLCSLMGSLGKGVMEGSGAMSALGCRTHIPPPKFHGKTYRANQVANAHQSL